MKNILFLLVLVSAPVFVFAGDRLNQIIQKYNENRDVNQKYAKMSAGLSQQEKNSFKKGLQLEGLWNGLLPEVTRRGEFIETVYQGKKVTVSGIDVPHTKMVINGKTLTVDMNQNIYQNFISWSAILNQKSQGQFIFSFFTPDAEANPVLNALGLTVMAGSLLENAIQLYYQDEVKTAADILDSSIKKCKLEEQGISTPTDHALKSGIQDFFRTAEDLCWCDRKVMQAFTWIQFVGDVRISYCGDLSKLKTCMKLLPPTSPTFVSIVEDLKKVPFESLTKSLQPVTASKTEDSAK